VTESEDEMLEEFRDYFQQIEMSETIQRRAEDLCSEFGRFIPTPIKRVFVADAYDGGGVRRYQNLILVSANIVMECKNFVVSDNIDFVNLDNGVRWVEVSKTELKDMYGPTTIKSAVRVEVVLLPEAGTLTLHAVHNNCAKLAEFIREELLSRLGRGDPSS
jgi:hypothetical protein